MKYETKLKIFPYVIAGIIILILVGIYFSLKMSKAEVAPKPTVQFYETSVGSWQAPDYKTIEMTATMTGYSSSPDETWGDPFLTASGEKVGEGTIACPRQIPFGSVVETSWGQYRCEDRLAEKYDHRLDIWFPDKESAIQFGKKIEEIKINIFY